MTSEEIDPGLEYLIVFKKEHEILVINIMGDVVGEVE